MVKMWLWVEGQGLVSDMWMLRLGLTSDVIEVLAKVEAQVCVCVCIL